MRSRVALSVAIDPGYSSLHCLHYLSLDLQCTELWEIMKTNIVILNTLLFKMCTIFRKELFYKRKQSEQDKLYWSFHISVYFKTIKTEANIRKQNAFCQMDVFPRKVFPFYIITFPFGRPRKT